MPLEQGHSREVISRNIATLVGEGTPQAQAIAIAYHEARKSSGVDGGAWVQDADGDHWITVHPNGEEHEGRPVKLDGSGRVVAGMGGKFTGETMGEARASFEGPRSGAHAKREAETPAAPVASPAPQPGGAPSRRGASPENVEKHKALMAEHAKAREQRNSQARMLARPEIGGKLVTNPDGGLLVTFEGLADKDGIKRGGSYDASTGAWETDFSGKNPSVEKLKEAVNLKIAEANKARAAKSASSASPAPPPANAEENSPPSTLEKMAVTGIATKYDLPMDLADKARFAKTKKELAAAKAEIEKAIYVSPQKVSEDRKEKGDLAVAAEVGLGQDYIDDFLVGGDRTGLNPNKDGQDGLNFDIARRRKQKLEAQRPKAQDASDSAAGAPGVSFALFADPATGKVLWLHRQDGTWGMPGGHIEPGESPIGAVVRECVEEIGRAPDDGLTLALRDGRVTVYTTECAEFTPALNGEHDGYLWARPEDMPEPFAGVAGADEPQAVAMDDGSDFAAWAAAAWAQDKASIDVNGWHVVPDVPITKAGVFGYRGKQITGTGVELEPERIYYVLRPAEELQTPELLESCRLLPVINNHGPTLLGPAEMGLTPVDQKPMQGVFDGAHFDAASGRLIADAVKVVTDAIVSDIRAGKCQLSLGYRCEYEHAPGEYMGQHYDFVQRKLRANHLALVYSGRAGPDVAIALDSSELLEVPEMADNIAPEGGAPSEGAAMTPELIAKLTEAVSIINSVKPILDKLGAAEAAPAAAAEDGGAPPAIPAGKPEGEKPKDEKPAAMDAADVQRLVADGIKAATEKRAAAQALADKVSWHTGPVPASAMDSAEDVAMYACDKLGLPKDRATAVPALNGWLIAAGSGKPPRNTASASVQDSSASSGIFAAINAATNKEGAK